jgi:hypothetical protein
VLHYAMALASTAEKVTVTASPEDLNPDSPRRDVFIDQEQISKYAGVDASNSFKIITEFVPGSYMVHDQLHVRGGTPGDLGHRRGAHSQYQYRVERGNAIQS